MLNCEKYGNKPPEYQASEYDLMIFFSAKNINDLTGAEEITDESISSGTESGRESGQESGTESSGQSSGQLGGQLGVQSGGQSGGQSEIHSIDTKILNFCEEDELSVAELLEKLSCETRSSYIRSRIAHLRKIGLLEYTIPEKPNSRLQKYRLVKKQGSGR